MSLPEVICDSCIHRQPCELKSTIDAWITKYHIKLTAQELPVVQDEFHTFLATICDNALYGPGDLPKDTVLAPVS